MVFALYPIPGLLCDLGKTTEASKAPLQSKSCVGVGEVTYCLEPLE